MTTPLVSITTPTFNHERYIGECIESVLAQSFGDWEMIVVDDASTDRTAEKAAAYGDPRIRLVRHRERRGAMGLQRTYNEALALARGTYVAVLEGDDFWPRDKLELQLPAMEDPGVVLSYGTSVYVLEALDQFVVSAPKRPPSLRNNDPPGSALKDLLVGLTSPFDTGTVMIRGDALRRIGGFQGRADLPVVDLPTWMGLSLEGRFAGVPAVLAFWRRHGASVTLRYDAEILVALSRFGLEFAERNRDRIARVPGLDLEGLAERHRRAIEAFRRGHDYTRGRALLGARSWREGRRAFLSYLRRPEDPLRVAVSLVGVVGSLFGANWVEPLARWKGGAAGGQYRISRGEFEALRAGGKALG